MGLRFRKSIKLGPFRATLSKSGVSASVGVKGYRVTKMANGKTMKTASVPGTGISHVTVENAKHVESRKPKKRGPLIAAVAALVAVLLIGCMAGSSEKEEKEPSTASVATAVAPASKAEPTPAPQPAPAPDPAPNPQPPADLPPEPVPEPEPEPEPVPKPEPAPAPVPVPAPVPEPEPEPVASEPVGPAVIGNKNSEVYHELGCNSVSKVADKNKVNFDSADAAKAAGYRPCQNCH